MEARLFPAGTVPEYTTAEWYDGREAAPHLEQAGHRERLLLTADFVKQALRVEDTGDKPPTVIDFGCGDGGLLSLLPHTCEAWGYDLQVTNVEAAKARGVDVRLGDVVQLASSLDKLPGADICVVTEMLEHMVDPHGMVKAIHESGAEYIVASSPYTETEESHYGFHTWCWDLSGYRTMIENAGFKVVRQEMAWICQVVLGVRV